MLVIRLTLESFRFSWSALTSNLLRTVLSLLGITVGIFAILAVFTIVDSLERSIKKSLSFLDASNLDVRRFPYDFGPDIPWWEYIKRPFPTYDEYNFLKDNLKNAEGITIFSIIDTKAKHKNNSSNAIVLLGVSYGHKDVYDDFPGLEGRYFTEQECLNARNVAILGYRIKKELFGQANPIGKEIKIKEKKYMVIGTIPEQGDGILGENSKDENIWIPYKSFRKIYYTGRSKGAETIISLKGKADDIGLVELQAETTGLLRRTRGLGPKQKDNFAVNRQDAIMNIIGSTFDIIGIAGWAIGGFSILVGGFGIANIMFVSVRERTNIIGIQKSLGAKNYFILFQFLFEAIFLSVLGGAIGIALVFFLSFFNLGDLELILSFSNVVLGFGIATTIGVISGIIPAIVAAKMDPVIAIRTQ